MNARSALLSTVAALALLLASAPARAQTNGQETIDKVIRLNRDGLALYKSKHYDGARKMLKQALDLCEAAGLDHHPVTARTHIHLGIVIVGGFGQREIGSRQFDEALRIQPNIMLTPGVASPAVEDVFNEALVAVRPRSAASAPAEPPAAQVAEAEEPSGVSFGDAAPAGDDATRAPPTRAAEDVPGVERRPSPQARRGRDDDDDDDDSSDDVPRSRIQLGALLGAGMGWASGMADVNADTPVSGSFAAAKLGHLTAELGYWLTSTWMLSLQGRFQVLSGPTVVEANGRTYEPASGATAIFGAATWSPRTGRLRPYLSGSVGGGSIRHVVTLSALKDCGPARNEVCVDTVGGGPFLAGAGGGLTFDLGERLALVVAVGTQIGAPRFTFNVDVNGGVAFHL